MFKWPEFPNGQKQGQKNIEPYHVLSEVDQMLIRHFQGPWNDFYPRGPNRLSIL